MELNNPNYKQNETVERGKESFHTIYVIILK